MEYFDLTIEKCNTIKYNSKTAWHIIFKQKYIEIKDGKNFNACDSLGILAPNPEKNIKLFCDAFNLKNIYLEDKKMHFYDYLVDIDINLFPRKEFLRSIEKNISKKNFLHKILNTELYNECVKTYHFIDITHLLGVKYFDEIDFVKHSDKIKPRNYILINKPSEKLEIVVTTHNFNNLIDKIPNHLMPLKQGHFTEFLKNNAFFTRNLHGFVKGNIQLNDFKRNSKKIIFICSGIGIVSYFSCLNNIESFEQNIDFNDCELFYKCHDIENNILSYFKNNKEKEAYFKGKVHIIYSTKNNSNFMCKIREKIQNLSTENIFVSGSFELQKQIYLAVKEISPFILQEKRLFFDIWH
ncbi:hypothetical protein EHP00_1083 [Ecytonucleospora hepatopenaei]|uniref:Uncharacterized protein n=1 Tax=Ecytonucleospora hepatopenaei TaxID=646526 RepID=A0A1W0E591_9MICR|nr:hypothetical protein EHP00_1083 [Ecytonucleospora hepatopenaei]